MHLTNALFNVFGLQEECFIFTFLHFNFKNYKLQTKGNDKHKTSVNLGHYMTYLNIGIIYSGFFFFLKSTNSHYPKTHLTSDSTVLSESF